AHRDKRRAMYAGEAPKPVTGEPVWEIGQGEPDWSGRKKPQEKRYYVVGKRPLDAPVMKGLYGETVNDTPVEHWQFIADDGSNKGLFPQGFKSDDTSLIHAYGYQDTQKYDAAIMDQAMDEVEKEMIKHSGGEKEVYAFLKNNCQNYVNTVLDRAREIAKNKEVSLITD
ncbi:hypothetical protein LJC26_06855, partial [Desulfovibrio sp. OttesenSCG-928-O18]|nr:hypothetical protein [Desulfovibrio sp. OttesenSCG-928-O18]